MTNEVDVSPSTLYRFMRRNGIETGPAGAFLTAINPALLTRQVNAWLKPTTTRELHHA